jgi:sec-independent protein translocase protein TatC
MLIYISEIKNRIILLFLTWVSILVIGYFYKETLLFLFVESDVFKNTEFKVYYFIFTDVTEIFSVYIKLVLFVSFQIVFFYLFYHSFTFLSRGLFITEYYSFKYMLQVILLVWVLSIIMSKYMLIPTMWDFFLNFKTSSFINFYFEAKLNEYLDFYIRLYYLFIAYCQVFTLLFIFFKGIKTNVLIIKKSRKLFYYFFILFSTLISPPEVLSQIALALILTFFYELCVFIYIFKTITLQLTRKPIETYKDTCRK